MLWPLNMFLMAIWIVTGMLAISAVFGFSWAVNNGQFRQPEESARSIFELGELGEDDD